MKNLAKKLKMFVGTKLFFSLVIVFFVLQAGWLAVSARYPMAFDEGFHVGIIKLYSEQWNPIQIEQPPGPAPYGSLATDPSYLYHYAMSFSYRILSSRIANQMTVIVLLRLINVGMFTVALLLFRSVLLRARASPAIVHVTLLFFTLVPVVPLVAAHVNYDNLTILLVALDLLITLKFKDQLEKKRESNAGLILHLASFGMLACLVKFVFLPIFLAIALYIFYMLVHYIGSPRKVWVSFRKNWRKLTITNRAIALSLFILSLALFLQRYAVNTVKYHNLIPQCGQVLSVEQCEAYGPWARNYHYAQSKTGSSGNPAIFLGTWFFGMFYRSFFAINGPGGPSTYDNKPPLPLLTVVAVGIFVFGLYLVVRYRGKLFKNNPALKFLLFVSFTYVAALMGRNYNDYLHLGQMVAINGRYLILIILPVMLTIALAYQQFLKKHHKAALLVIVFLLFLQGGGAISYIYDSNRNWYRTDNQPVIQANQKIQKAIKPFILNWPNIK
jgi:hypothetical protein